MGGDVVVNSGRCIRGDEANLLKPIGGHALVKPRTTPRVGPGEELYGIAGKRFATFGVSPGPARAFSGGTRVLF